MTTSTATSTAVPAVATARRARPSWPAVAGIAYSVSWIVGLCVSSASTDVSSSGAQIVAALAGHEGAATTQYALTEGAPAVLLAVVVVALARAAQRAGSRMGARLVAITGLVAAGISLVQCGLGGYLTTSLVPAADAHGAGVVTEVINRLDGVKMLLLAALAIAGMQVGRRMLPRWLSYVGVALAIALVASGAGYLFLIGAAAQAAYVSLPLLLIWVTGAGVALARAGR
jgi:hypothetical protein